MIFAQLCSRQSLRNIVSAWDSHARSYYHIGARRVKRPTLADANAKHLAGMYMELFYYPLGKSGGNRIHLLDGIP